MTTKRLYNFRHKVTRKWAAVYPWEWHSYRPLAVHNYARHAGMIAAHRRVKVADLELVEVAGDEAAVARKDH